MAHQILSVTFRIEAQSWRDGQFTIPVEVCSILGVEGGGSVHLVVSAPMKHIIYTGVEELKSGNEVYSDGLRDAVTAGDQLVVEVSAAAKEATAE